MTVMEALQWANERLKKENVGDSPMLDAQVLLGSVLGVSKSRLFTHLDREMDAREDESFQKLITRRAAHEPVAYIVGSREFYKRPFHVNRFVLIPRPATEILIDAALESAKSLDPESTLFVDIGTGSGAIAVTLAAESHIPVIATDESKHALAVAKKNAEDLGVESLVDFRQGNLLEPIVSIFEKTKEKAGSLPFKHLILAANLPYLTEHQWETAEADVRDWEPKTALVGGVDGLDLYWQMFRELLRHRSTFPRKVTTLIEIDPSQRDRAMALVAHSFPRATPRILDDLEGLARVVVADV